MERQPVAHQHEHMSQQGKPSGHQASERTRTLRSGDKCLGIDPIRRCASRGGSVVRIAVSTATRAFIQNYVQAKLCSTVEWHTDPMVRFPKSLNVLLRSSALDMNFVERLTDPSGKFIKSSFAHLLALMSAHCNAACRAGGELVLLGPNLRGVPVTSTCRIPIIASSFPRPIYVVHVVTTVHSTYTRAKKRARTGNI